MNKDIEEMKKRYKAGLLHRQIKGHFTDYCTEDIDVSSPCDTIREWDCLSFKFEYDQDWCLQMRRVES